MILDYVRRIIIVIVLALCISVIFLAGKEAKAEENRQAIDTTGWTFPVEGIITDAYGTRAGTHKGVDIGGEIGTPVYSVDKGRVIKSYYSPSYGNVVFVRHDNGYETVYAHLEKRLVEVDQDIDQGEQIGLLGNTGRSTGAHLHFEVHNGEWTIEKEHAFDPFLIYGYGEIGQLVFANTTDPYQTVVVSGDIHEHKKLSVDTLEIEQVEQIHTVSKAETLWAISENYHVAVEDLMKRNELNNTIVIENQKLIIPKKSNSDYIVKKGDTLYSIAKAHSLEISTLLEWNGLELDKPIFPQQVLKLQGG
ncbi:M23 family metallopeptidase [Rossellomorea aquimaris]|uniref:M23 family metallopeptidase n=1 Tax=Rossellomorea aquimaris TaxID=189382 RepID=UPI0009ED0E24|nr:M23 family metallopeptidase [Rossellomorea aquimaris]